MIDFNILKTAGITQEQFGQLIGVSRVTVNRWAKGRDKISRRQATSVHKALVQVARAVEMKALPADERTQQVLDAIGTTLKG